MNKSQKEKKNYSCQEKINEYVIKYSRKWENYCGTIISWTSVLSSTPAIFFLPN